MPYVERRYAAIPASRRRSATICLAHLLSVLLGHADPTSIFSRRRARRVDALPPIAVMFGLRAFLGEM